MPVPGLDADRCKRRNARAARLGCNAIPVVLTAKAPAPIDTTDPDTAKGMRVITARGTLPRTEADAVDRINSIRGEGMEALTASQVYVCYAEAGNSNFIRKYFMFLADSTLRNIARRAGTSIAFMNSHRTGGISTDAELPYGRTFAGRFEQIVTADDRPFSRTMLGVYMIRGQRPNGDSGPSTDDLYAGIKAGTIFDVSLGIQGGTEICDVCGNELDTYDEQGNQRCVHMPGTHYRMSDDEIEAQIKRGVPKGMASFTLEDGTAGEVSPVFDGAVPGAGFRKVLAAAKRRELSAEDLGSFRRSFAPLLLGRQPRPGEQQEGRNMAGNAAKKTIKLSALQRLLEQAGAGDDIEIDVDTGSAPASTPRPAAATPTPAPSPEPAAARPVADNDVEDRLRALEQTNNALQRQLEEERKERQKETVEQRRQTVQAQANSWADIQLRAGVVTPAERDGLVSLHAQAAMDDAEHPTPVSYRDATNTAKVGTRLQALEATWSKRGAHGFGHETIAPRDSIPNTPGSDGAPGTGGVAPLVNLHDLPSNPSADVLGDRMALAAKDYAARMNGRQHTQAPN